jgi:O-methyltransferase involved in polyketide biosynthesis
LDSGAPVTGACGVRKNAGMTDTHRVELGTIQETMLLTLADRAVDARKKRSVLRDAKAVEILESIDHPLAQSGGMHQGTVTRTAIYDSLLRGFLDQHPAGTVVELGSGLNTRFERVDNGQVHWIDLDLPDSIEVRRKFFTDTDRRRMLAGSALDADWHDTVAALPGPYLFLSEGVLAYLPRADVDQALAEIVSRFPGATMVFDTYNRRTHRRLNRMADEGKMDARLAWACEDPREFESLGLTLISSDSITNPPREVRERLPVGLRVVLPMLHPLGKNLFRLNMFRAAE